MAKHPRHEQTEPTSPLDQALVEESNQPLEEVTEGNLIQAPMVAPAVVPTYDPDYLASCQNLSQRIRYLNSRGLTNSQIVKVLKVNAKGSPLIYQHVRNVLKQSVKKSA